MTGRPQTAAAEPFFAATLSDPRADRGRREIAIDGEHVLISRSLRGIDMRLSLPVSAYRGVALCLRPGKGEAMTYQIRLVHADDDLCVLLDEALDDRNIIADWRLWARVLGLPALVERELGAFAVAEATLDCSNVDTLCDRRLRPNKTRPRFLARRQPGRPIDGEAVYTGEREIIART